MKMQSQVTCIGIKESQGSMEGKAFSSTKFHLIVDIADNTAGRSIGQESRPFTFGDATEFLKWQHLKNSFPVTGIPVICTFEVVAAADGKTKLTLLDIKPSTQTLQPKAV